MLNLDFSGFGRLVPPREGNGLEKLWKMENSLNSGILFYFNTQHDVSPMVWLLQVLN